MLDGVAKRLLVLPERMLRESFRVILQSSCDAAVSVESLHHFPADSKAALYGKLHAALTENGIFVLTDYFAKSEELEKEYFCSLANLKKEQGLSDGAIYHYDTPLLVGHEMDILRRAGFRDVRIMKRWGESTYTVWAAAQNIRKPEKKQML